MENALICLILGFLICEMRTVIHKETVLPTVNGGTIWSLKKTKQNHMQVQSWH
jgi:hypothetical protein